MCYPKRRSYTQSHSLPPSVRHLHRLERAHCVTQLNYSNSSSSGDLCVRCGPRDLASQKSDLRFTHSLVVTTRVVPERCCRCNVSLSETRNADDCPECVLWFTVLLTAIEAQGVEFHELDDPTEFRINQLTKSSDFILSGPLISFSLGLLRHARLRALEQADEARARSPPSE